MKYLTFHLNELYLGIAAAEVLEVNRGFQITPVPKSPAMVQGIANLRGEIILAIDMHARFEIERKRLTPQAIGVILHCKRMMIAAIVDQVGDIIELYEDTFELPPSNFPEASRELILGVHKLPDRLMLIVDSQKIWSDAPATVPGLNQIEGELTPFLRIAH